MATYTHQTVGYVPELDRWFVCRRHRSEAAAHKLVASLNSSKKSVFVGACFPYSPVEFKVEAIAADKGQKDEAAL